MHRLLLAMVDLLLATRGGLPADLSEDLGLSLNYAVHPALLFRVEGHTNEGWLREDVPRNLYAPASKTRYFIASVVASF